MQASGQWSGRPRSESGAMRVVPQPPEGAQRQETVLEAWNHLAVDGFLVKDGGVSVTPNEGERATE